MFLKRLLDERLDVWENGSSLTTSNSLPYNISTIKIPYNHSTLLCTTSLYVFIKYSSFKNVIVDAFMMIYFITALRAVLSTLLQSIPPVVFLDFIQP